jgi:hypothetical protein
MKQESDRQIAERLSGELGFPVTRACVRYWRKRSFDLSNPEKLRHQIRNLQKSRPGAKQSSDPADSIPAPVARTVAELESQLIAAPDFETSRTISTKLAGLKNAHRLRAEMSLFVSRESVERERVLVDEVFRAVVLKMARELPGIVIDVQYAEAVQRCQDYTHQILLEVSSAETYAGAT